MLHICNGRSIVIIKVGAKSPTVNHDSGRPQRPIESIEPAPREFGEDEMASDAQGEGASCPEETADGSSNERTYDTDGYT